MRWTLIFLATLITNSFALQNTPYGWASQNGGTTGGAGGTEVEVNNLKDLQDFAGRSGKYIIYVKGTMGKDVGTRVAITSNKTVFGLPGAKLIGGIDIKNAQNVILRNLIIEGPGAVDVDGVDCLTLDNATNIWLDHLDLRDGQDGNFDITKQSNYVTGSWIKYSYSSKSQNHQFSNLIGNSDSRTTDRNHLKVTLHHNWWTDGVKERMPRVRFGQVHVVNNLFDSPNSSTCIRAAIEADLLIESNAFIGVNKPIDLYKGDYTGVTVKNNYFDSKAGKERVGDKTSFTPPYTMPIDNATQIQSIVSASAGATLADPRMNTNNPPVITSANKFTIAENSDYKLALAQLTATDAEGNALNFSLSGADQGEFLLSASTRNLYFAKIRDYENPQDADKNNVYEITLNVSDGSHSVSQNIQVFVIDVNEVTNKAPTALNLTNNAISENVALGTLFGEFVGVDDVADLLTYSLVAGAGDSDNHLFSIEGNALLVQSPMDYETQNTFSIRVQVTDQGGLSFAKSFNLELFDQVERSYGFKVEGEDFCKANGVLENKNLGFEGAGYLNIENTVGSKASWVVHSNVTGEISLAVRYANGDAVNRPISVNVNGVEQWANVDFQPSGSWTTWTAIPILLNVTEGQNEIVFSSLTASGGPNFDWLGFNEVGVSANEISESSCVIDDPTSLEKNVLFQPRKNIRFKANGQFIRPNGALNPFYEK